MIQYPDSADFDKIACSLVNPITVVAFAHYAKKYGHKAIVHGAACSSLGKQLVKHAKKIGLPLINIVRREEQAKKLAELGAEHIVNSSDENFGADLKKIVDELGATAYFDPIGGSFTGQVLDQMPPKSTAYVYGGLSGEAVSYSPLGLIFGQKTISYVWLSPWLEEITAEEKNEVFGTIIKDLSSGGEVFGADIYKTYKLSDFAQAIEDSQKHASEGKCIIKPQE